MRCCSASAGCSIEGASEPRRAPVSLEGDQEFLRHPGLDLVDICTPTWSHPALAIAALQAGKHVLCEKPLARTSPLAHDIANAAAEAKGYQVSSVTLEARGLCPACRAG